MQHHCRLFFTCLLTSLLFITSITNAQNTQYQPEGPIAPVPAPIFTDNSKWTVEVDGALTTAYWFRGISQRSQNQNGVIIQTYNYVGLEVFESDSLRLVAHAETWNDFTTVNREGDGGWYESDPSLGITTLLPDYNLAIDVSYLWLIAVAQGREFDQEIDVLVEYNDEKFWNNLTESMGFKIAGFEGFQPHILFAFETSGAADEVGDGGGIYFEFGIDPTIQILPEDIFELYLSFPTRVGNSLNNYFQAREGASSDLFGFFEAGLQLSAPLNGIGPEYGDWAVYGRFDLLLLSDQLRELSREMGTSDDSLQFIGTVGINATF
ncbi:hypothetical protein JD969_19360 [Planctomycetota bacterium]|nr:hypothetical protein JD969_19360 [Planctomycetota bacterium]